MSILISIDLLIPCVCRPESHSYLAYIVFSRYLAPCLAVSLLLGLCSPPVSLYHHMSVPIVQLFCHPACEHLGCEHLGYEIMRTHSSTL